MAQLPGDVRSHLLEREDTSSNRQVSSIPSHLPFRDQVEMFQRALLLRTWSACKGRKKLLQESLDLAPHQLKYLIRKFDLKLDSEGE